MNKSLEARASCRNLLDELAKSFAASYVYAFGPGGNNKEQTFGDVIFAYDNRNTKDRWIHLNFEQTRDEITDESGFIQAHASKVPKMSIPLPELLEINGKSLEP